MSAIVINGTTYGGPPTGPWAPTKIEKIRRRIGKVLLMASGLRIFVYMNSTKNEWRLSWEMVNETTRAAVVALYFLTTTFTFVDQFGNSHTVQVEDDELPEETAFTRADNTIYYNVSIVLHQGN
jgi:hypothetical protein